MSEPEIARRCPSCGASIRELALFCLQCGKELPPRASNQTQPLVAPVQEEKLRKNAAPASDQDAEPGKEARKSSSVVSGKESPTETSQGSQKERAVKDPATQKAKGSVGQAALGAVGAKIQRATTLARDVEGDVIHRVQRVRQISSVVLDEAGYDPSLRFVLVAAVLFVLFLIIVLLNRFIT